MAVKRIVANIETADPQRVAAFYAEILNLEPVMDLGWILTCGAAASMRVQVSFAQQGGSQTPVPDLSIEVDDLDAVLQKARAAEIPIEYGPVSEPWGVRRIYLRDPCGKLLNILQHE